MDCKHIRNAHIYTDEHHTVRSSSSSPESGPRTQRQSPQAHLIHDRSAAGIYGQEGRQTHTHKDTNNTQAHTDTHRRTQTSRQRGGRADVSKIEKEKGARHSKDSVRS